MKIRETRVGLGFDAHQFAEGRRLLLGGIEIPHLRGLDGHSDADAALHALADALLGAAGLGDIGLHFPSGDPSLAGMDSARIVEKVVRLLAAAGWEVGNVDVTVVAQEPRLAPHIGSMRGRIASVLGIDEVETVSVKATTTDRMGSVGRGEGIAAIAVATVVRTISTPDGGDFARPSRRPDAARKGRATGIRRRSEAKSSGSPGTRTAVGKRKPAGGEESTKAKAKPPAVGKRRVK